MIKHYCPNLILKEGSESSQSALQESEISDLVKYLDGDEKGDQSSLEGSLDDKSFVEYEYTKGFKSPLNKTKRQRNRENLGKKFNEVQGKFSELTYKLIKKMSPYEIKITQKDVFPLKVYDSQFLKQALDSFEIVKPVRKNFKKLFLVKSFRKAYTYLWWVVFALKFKNCTFGDIDHFNGRDQTTKAMKKNQRIELYALSQEDLKLGLARRISLIKYWRQKFSTHICEAR